MLMVLGLMWLFVLLRQYGSHLRHLLTRLDYNGYYSRSMDLHTSRAGLL